MTSEELNRTIEFIIQSQARLAAAQEQDRADRVTFEEWSKGLFTEIAADRKRMIEIVEIQSRRLDRAEREDHAAQKRHDHLMHEIRKLKDRTN